VEFISWRRRGREGEEGEGKEKEVLLN